MKSVLVPILVLAAGSVVTSPSLGEDAAEPHATPKAAKPAGPPDQLRVEVVISRFQGETRVSNAPYSFLIAADNKKAVVKMGVEVPVAVTEFPENEGIVSFQYRNVGTNIICFAEDRGEGLYQLRLMVETSSIYGSPVLQTGRAPTELAGGKPIFNSFSVNLDPLLRDGQSVEAVASTDPVTGDVVKIDVSLNVKKGGR